MACSMCSGTDCAAACNQGQCYAEYEQARQMNEDNERERYEQEMERDREEGPAPARKSVWTDDEEIPF